jgi:histidine triad (HIT) family protein
VVAAVSGEVATVAGAVPKPPTHAPPAYECPFCQVAAGQERPSPGTQQADVVYRDGWVTAFIANKWWPHNPGHVLIIPNRHYENLFDLPETYGGPFQAVSRAVAYAFKEVYGAAGVSTRQHNEPDGNQDVWHYHLHVYPRYPQDNLYGSQGYVVGAEARAPFASRLRAFLSEQGQHLGLPGL